MAEVPNEADLKHKNDFATPVAVDHTADQVLRTLDVLYSAVGTLDEVRDTFLRSHDPGDIIDPKESPSFRAYCFMLARTGRQAHRDRHEINHTSVKLGAIIAALHEQQPVYAKTRSQIPGKAPEYTLGSIITTQAVIVPDTSPYPIENKVALCVRTPSGRHGEKRTEICIDDIAAQLEIRADTGSDTPIVIVGHQAVKEYVKQAYANPRAERSASGIDSCDIFWAMCESRTSLTQLGFSDEEVKAYKTRIIANLNNVCREGATYQHDIPMLLPVCDSIRETIYIIDTAVAEDCHHKTPLQLERERNLLLDGYLPLQSTLGHAVPH